MTFPENDKTTTKDRAKTLRRKQTDAEKRLWYFLRSRGLAGKKFRRQYIVGPYIVDFVCLEKRLVVEINGGHHARQRLNDARRTRFLESQGFRVVRFWDNQVLKETESVLEVIRRKLIE